jgi:radical SAM protein with 4Fe4S-binding SPASM domain
MAWTKIPNALKKLPGLLLNGKLAYDFDGVPLFPYELPLKKRINLIKTGMDMVLRSDKMRGLPPIIQVEPTNYCNLNCPLCPSGSGSLKRPKQYLSLDVFRRILDELGDTLIAVYLFCFGEPFMHKDFLHMTEECSSRRIMTMTSTNGHFVQTFDEALKVVDSGLKTLVVALDGSTPEVYRSYRQNGSLEKVMNFITLVEEAKVRRGSEFPYTATRAIITRKNETDIPNLEKLSRELGVNMFTYKSVGCLIHENDYQEFEPVRKDMRRYEYAGSSRLKQELILCPFPFRQPIVFCDGTVVGCEYDHDSEVAFGKIGEKSFSEIWNSPNARKLRKTIHLRKNRPSFCQRCPYQDNVRKGTELWCKELRPIHG